MNIAAMTMYGTYYNNDRLFDASSCNIGQNLLLPGIKLKEQIEKMGHRYHTVDLYEPNEIDRLICFDIPTGTLSFLDGIKDFARYLIRGQWRTDYFYSISKRVPVENRILIVQEPPVVSPKSYKKKYHKRFGKILIWNSELVDNKKYFQFNYPQPLPDELKHKDFSTKKMFTQISGNKKGIGANELYSERLKVIEYFENKDEVFDFYGMGWDKENYKNYKGAVDDKLESLSNYKFSFTFENCFGLKGYITEKIFDCFFAGTVPIYWGAEDVDNYIPKECFIDMRKFESIDSVVQYCTSMSEEEYENYISFSKKFLDSEAFTKVFSVDAYIDNICKAIFE